MLPLYRQSKNPFWIRISDRTLTTIASFNKHTYTHTRLQNERSCVFSNIHRTYGDAIASHTHSDTNERNNYIIQFDIVIVSLIVVHSHCKSEIRIILIMVMNKFYDCNNSNERCKSPSSYQTMGFVSHNELSLWYWHTVPNLAILLPPAKHMHLLPQKFK